MNARSARRCRSAAKTQAAGFPSRTYRTLPHGQIVLHARTIRSEAREMKRLACLWRRKLGARYRIAAIAPLPF